MTANAAPQYDTAAIPLPDGSVVTGGLEDGQLVLTRDGDRLLSAGLEKTKTGTILHVEAATVTEPAVWGACYWCFAADPNCQRLEWPGAQLPDAAWRSGLVVAGDSPVSERAMFWQLPTPWVRAARAADYPLRLTMTEGRRHPTRPPQPVGEVYRRYDNALGAWFSLRMLDIATDLERFNRWHNLPRVSAFWNQANALETHRQYLQNMADDPHQYALIGCFDDEPFACFEVYWAKEDHYGPYCQAADYDRGIHMLVGEEHHRGPHKVASWLSGLVHYLFLDEPRTQRIVSEPRADNDRMINHMMALGFYRRKEFDFPHKRAAMMTIERDAFFERCPLR